MKSQELPLVTERVRVIPFRWRWWERIVHWVSRGRWLPYRTITKAEGILIEGTGYLYGLTLDVGRPLNKKYRFGGDVVFVDDTSAAGGGG